MTTQHTIRRATPEDRSAILSFQRAAIAQVKPGTYPAEALDSWWRTPTANLDSLIDAGRYYVAENDGRLVAGAGWEPDWRIKDTAVLRAAFVDPGHRAQGLGARLTQIVEDAAVTAGFDHILVPALLNATGFYRKLGYVNADPDDYVLSDGVRIGYRRMWKHAA
jgi:GNAT superfamily N-acetyltransferase